MSRSTILQFLLPSLFILLFWPVSEGNAQNRGTIIQAGKLETSQYEGQRIRKITDNVILSTDKMVLQTDSVYQFLDQSLLMAFNTQIETENDMIWADTLYHNTETEYSRLRGRVIIQSSQNTVFSDSMDVDQQQDLAIFNVPFRFEDDKGALIAQSGLYFQAADSAIFRGQVQLSDSTQYLEADSLFMNRSSDLYELFGNVYADDFEENVKFSGDYLYADSLGQRLLEGNAWMMEVSESLTDTTHLFAQRIELLESEGESFMDAYGTVRIWSTKFEAIADTANYREDPDQFFLRSSPILWQKRMQLSGPYIEANMDNDDIRQLISYSKPVIVMEDSVTARLHQMTGDTLHAHFDDGALNRVRVFNNTVSIFHNKDENDEPDGLIEMISTGPLLMYFTDGDIDSLVAKQNIDGSYLPEDPQNIERKLENFRWDPELRPMRPVMRVPGHPPVTDERPFPLPPRYVQYINEQE